MKQRHKARSNARALLSTIAALGLGAGAFNSSPVQSSDAFQLEEIVVTVTKRTENIQDVAATVRSLSGERLKALDVKDIADIVNLLPNVQIKGHPSEEITIRGISSSRLGQSSVARHVNGIYKYDHWSYLGIFHDVANVEVIQGPTGTEYGRNATAGAINVIHNKPTSEFEAFGDVGVGNYNQRQVRGVVNIPFLGEGNERLMGRFAFQRETRDGFVENKIGDKDEDFQQADDTMLRASFRSVIDDDSELEVRGYWNERKGDYEGVAQITADEYPVGELLMDTLNPIPFTFDAFHGLQQYTEEFANRPGFNKLLTDFNFAAGGFATREEAAQDVLLNGLPNLGVPPIIFDEESFVPALPILTGDREVRSQVADLGDPHWQVYGTDGEYSHSFTDLSLLGDARLNVLLGWERISRITVTDNDGTELRIVDTRVDWDADTYTAEARLTSENDGPLKWMVGAFYFDRKMTEAQTSVLQFGVRTTDKTLKEKGLGVFVSGAYDLTDALELFGGLRWNRDTVDITDQAFGVGGSVPGDPPLDDDATFRKITGELGVRYRISEDHMVYLKKTEGYKPGSIELIFREPDDPVQETTNNVDPELIDAWEVGVKTEWLDNRLRVNASAFYYDYTDLQVPIITAFNESTLNAGEATIKGLEVDVTFLVTPEWEVALTVGRLDATFDEFCAFDPWQFDAPTDPACAGAAAGAGVVPADGTLDLSGNTLEDAPEWKVGLFTSYDLDFGDNGTLKSVLQVTWTDDYYLRPFNQEIDEVDAYATTDVRFIWKSPAEKYTVEAFIKNLEDKTVVNRMVILPVFTGPWATGYGVNPPRTFGVRVGYRFGE